MRLLSMLRTRLFGVPEPVDDSADQESGVTRSESPTAPTESAPGPPEHHRDLANESAGSEVVEKSDATIAARQERAAGRILDNERLRGDLTDDEYQPLLDWALSMTDQVAASTGELDDEVAEVRLDSSIAALAEMLEAAGYAIVAHQEGDAERRRRELEFLGERLDTALARTPTSLAASDLPDLADRLDAEPELSGTDVARAIVEALRPSNVQEAR